MEENNNSAEFQNESQQPETKESSEQSETSKIIDLEKKLAEANDRTLRALAELENVRRRSREEVLKSSKFAISNFASDLVVVVENFFLASENAPKEELEKVPAVKSYADAVSMIEKELIKVLEKNHIKRISPLNEKFDHNFHEALVQVESDVEEGTVIQVIQAGYSISDRLIRPALVGVSKSKTS
jgi:molecular chaperone GrpE